MNINAESIQKKEFHVVFKGYKPEEVDKFLDILTVEFDRLQKSQRQLQENLERLKYDGNKESVEMKRVIQEALVSAHKVAEDIKRKAEKEAEEIVRNKIAKEEEAYKYLLGKKAQLERDIKKLNQEYEGFEGEIYKVVDDFKETTSKLADEKFIKIPEIGEKVLDIDKIKIGEGAEEEKLIVEEEKEEKLIGEEKEEKPIGIGEKEEEEEEKLIGEGEKEGGKEEEEEKYKPKRVKKKIDIANPDIINDFFKTDED